ncbi:MAG: hypothetical protein ACI83O_000061 [Patescibacteria group bacterium]|jgi:hypothetical protein
MIRGHTKNKRGFSHFHKVLFVVVVFIFLFVIAFQFKSATSQVISSQPGGGPVQLYDKIEKTYEISQTALEVGTFIPIEKSEALRLNHLRSEFTIFIINITQKNAALHFFGKGTLFLEFEKSYIVDLDDDGTSDVEVFMNRTNSGQAQFFIKRFKEESLLLTGDYFELFDVTMRLKESLIYSTQDLGAFVLFENFGDGASKINIVYSIINAAGEEVFHGVDIKVVQTQDSIFKSFEYLNLDYGIYTVKAEIFYGDNQTAGAEQQFKLAPVPISSLIKEPLIFTISIIIIFGLILWIRRFSEI